MPTFGTPRKNSDTSGTTRTVDKPSDLSDGDYWLILLAKDDDPTVTAPTGFSTIVNAGQTSGDDVMIAGFYKYYSDASSAPSTVDITGGDSEEWVTVSVAVKTADPTTFLSGTAGTPADSQNSSTPTAAAPNSGGASGDLTVSFVGSRYDGITGIQAPTGMTLLAAYQSGTGSDGNIAVAYENWVDNASHDFQNANGTRDWIGSSFVIKAGTDPYVTDVETDEEFRDGDTAITITGGNFESTQGTGKVELSDNATYASGTKVSQTVTSWADTSIDFTVVLSTLDPGTLYLWVTNDSGDRSPATTVTVHRKVAFTLSASANITASGEDTTAQLTAPSGKTTGDFDAGRIQDDENPTDAVDITEDDYTELEWAIEATADAIDSAQYEFRVLAGTSTLNTYSVTPKFTVTAGGSSETQTNTGSVTPTGSLTTTTSLSSSTGTVTSTSTLSSMASSTLAGTVALSGSLSTVHTAIQTSSGSITPASTLALKVSTTLPGSVSPSGTTTLGTLAFRTFAGAITPNGGITTTYQDQVGTSGTIVPTGSAAFSLPISLAGSVAPTSMLRLRVVRPAVGVVAPTGALVPLSLAKTLTGTIVPIGSTTKAVTQTPTGSVSPTGTLSTSLLSFIALSGPVTPAGSLTLKVTTFPSGFITPSGSHTPRFVATFAGSVTPTSTLTFTVVRSLTGTITPTGSVTNILTDVVQIAGTITPASSLLLSLTHSLSGTVTPTSQNATGTTQTLVGSVSPSSTLSTALVDQGVSAAGSTTPTSTLKLKVSTSPVGTVAPTGQLVRQIAVLLTGSSSPSGSVAPAQTIVLTGVATPSGTLAFRLSRTLAGAAPSSGSLTQRYEDSVGTSGSISPIGSLTLVVSTSFTGSSSPSATTAHVTISPDLTPTGLATPSGALTMKVFASWAGSTALTGTTVVAGQFRSALVTILLSHWPTINNSPSHAARTSPFIISSLATAPAAINNTSTFASSLSSGAVADNAVDQDSSVTQATSHFSPVIMSIETDMVVR